MRIIKTAIGVGICFLIYNLISTYFTDKVSPFYSSIAVILTLEKTVDLTRKLGLHRIGGTIIGSTVALVMVMLSNLVNKPTLDFLFVAVGIVIVIKLCMVFNIPKGVGVSCIILCAVFSMADRPIIEYISYRAIETLLGVSIAIIVNRLLPGDYSEQVKT
jgi:uncharacterized membrane protein YgaE (UPF0421/DUF939 family)